MKDLISNGTTAPAQSSREI